MVSKFLRKSNDAWVHLFDESTKWSFNEEEVRLYLYYYSDAEKRSVLPNSIQKQLYGKELQGDEVS